MKTITMNKSLVALSVTALLAGCVVGPDYQRPALELPTDRATVATGLAQAATSASWWTVFNDPMLDRVMDEALKNNLDLVVAAARVSEARAQLGLAVSDQLPSAYATGGYERNRNSAESSRSAPGQPLQSTTYRGTLNVSYEIDFWGKYRRASAAARADLLAVEANRDAMRLSLSAQTVQGYFSVLALDARIAATRLAIARSDEALGMQKKRFDAGVISEFDFQQRAAEADAARAQLPPLVSQLGKEERALKVLLGRSPREIFDGEFQRSPKLTPLNTVALPPALHSELLLKRPDLIAAEQRLIAATARIGVARAAYFPSISLTGLLGSESESLRNLFNGPSRVWNFAAGLTQPLWGAGRVGKQVDVADAQKEQAVAQYRNAIASAFRDVKDAIAAQSAARDVYEIDQQRLASYGKAWELAKLRYANGVASQLDVIDSERGLLLAELDRISGLQSLRNAVTDLYRAMGGNVPLVN